METSIFIRIGDDAMTKLESLSALWELAGHSKTSIKQDDVLNFCERIKQEVDERYMLLPVDADGVPIQVGDELHGEHAKPIRRVIAVGNGEYICDCQVVRHANLYHHVKPRTVEDVLHELLDDVKYEAPEYRANEAISHYAAELQMRGDEE